MGQLQNVVSLNVSNDKPINEDFNPKILQNQKYDEVIPSDSFVNAAHRRSSKGAFSDQIDIDDGATETRYGQSDPLLLPQAADPKNKAALLRSGLSRKRQRVHRCRHEDTPPSSEDDSMEKKRLPKVRKHDEGKASGALQIKRGPITALCERRRAALDDFPKCRVANNNAPACCSGADAVMLGEYMQPILKGGANHVVKPTGTATAANGLCPPGRIRMWNSGAECYERTTFASVREGQRPPDRYELTASERRPSFVDASDGAVLTPDAPT
jgi:hypothetical protein